MPEGDTIFRTAQSLRRWIGGRTITATRDRVTGLHSDRLVGSTLEQVETRGKNLLIAFSPIGLTLHTHMRMTGSWHVYPAGMKWKRPERQMKLLLESEGRLAVCFNAPVIELNPTTDEHRNTAITSLGPDVLAIPLDIPAILRRARTWPRELAIGEMLINQRVLCGIGNIYRAETLFLCAVHPWTPQSLVSDDALAALVRTAADLMHANLVSIDRNFGSGPDRPWVYRRTGRPCRRCTTPIAARAQGPAVRMAYWCPACQTLKS